MGFRTDNHQLRALGRSVKSQGHSPFGLIGGDSRGKKTVENLKVSHALAFILSVKQTHTVEDSGNNHHGVVDGSSLKTGTDDDSDTATAMSVDVECSRAQL